MSADTTIQTVPRPTLGQIVKAMQKFAVEGGRSPKIILLAQKITNGVASGDYASEILAVSNWVHDAIRYVPDPTDNELVKDPERLLQYPNGDCDDIAVLCAALLMAIGKTVAFMTVAFNGAPVPSHVFAVVRTPGGWVPVDPVANIRTERMLRDATSRWIHPIGFNGASDGAW